MTAEFAERIITGPDFTAAIAKVANITRQHKDEAAFVVYGVPRLKSGYRVSPVITAPKHIGTVAEAADHKNETIRLDELVCTPNNAIRGDLLFAVHSHASNLKRLKSIEDALVPSTTDLESHERMSVSSGEVVSGVLAVDPELIKGRQIARMFLWRRTDGDAPNFYQQLDPDKAHGSGEVLHVMKESGMAVAEIQYDLETKQWLGDIALAVRPLFGE